MPALRYSEDTELNDALRARGIIPPLPKVESPPDSPIRSNNDDAKDRLGALLDQASTSDAVVKLELDDLDLEDELPTDLIEAWRDSRLEELGGADAVRRQASFGPGVRPIGREDYVREVNRASEKNLPDYDSNREGGRRAGTGVVLCLWNNSPQSQHLLALLERLSSSYPTTHCLSIAGRSCIDNYPDANQPTLLCYRQGQCARQYVGIGSAGNTQGTRFKGLETRLEDLEAELKSIGMLDEDLKDQRSCASTQVVSNNENPDEDESDDSESARKSARGSRQTKNIRNGFSARQSHTNDDDSDLDI
ncbi:uncharacterized protein MELLADRAFT_77140 [Melampsora larici-populina 98AG31]|uniref:Phosducin thioredoxin-like domain-containing protein n=1 Tax=Melampsora larici-populina (strain 98AG31 / pathotype 3-4-7) TaxID=747676 RepID=F4RDV6_MELLP|nr:uncharacterized protein MELLADRAFT_77140 [Melampsora larici-populina 98AG31]EGG09469.1 hypothetical protein MELLADRAFT_77140 [Melampsora larici-populina 98AG31]